VHQAAGYEKPNGRSLDQDRHHRGKRIESKRPSHREHLDAGCRLQRNRRNPVSEHRVVNTSSPGSETIAARYHADNTNAIPIVAHPTAAIARRPNHRAPISALMAAPAAGTKGDECDRPVLRTRASSRIRSRRCQETTTPFVPMIFSEIASLTVSARHAYTRT
jgi:hypothetical protein